MSPLALLTRRGCLATLILLVVAGGCTASREVERVTGVGVVASQTVDASKIGAEVLENGGNAVDAAIATAFALAVTWPEAGNLGGGGFMLVVEPGDDSPKVIDYRETAPAAATVDMYTPGENRHTPRHVGVPGTVAGLFMAHERHGTRPWRELVEPSVALARDGFVVDEILADSINSVLRDDPPAELLRVYGKPGGGDWADGDRIVLPELATVLQRIADDGPAGFYEGQTADQLATFMADTDGIITANDLRNYKSIVRDATRVVFRGYDVWGPPPPSSGGLSVGIALKLLEPFDLESNQPQTVHLMAEALRRAFHYRAAYLGDPDFGATAPLPQVDAIDPDRATPSELLRPLMEIVPESPDTTHFSVVDGSGMAVANTYTLEESWGSRQIAPGTGVVLNNEMGDFNWTPGRTTRSGAIGTPANLIAPGKRPLSSMTPTVVTRDGKLVLVTGSPGGRTIISTVLCVLVNRLALDMTPEDAVAAPRLHHGWLPDVLRVEPGLERYAESLRAMGHRVEVVSRQGSAHSIFVENGKIIGVADPRRGGVAVATKKKQSR